MNKEKRTFEEVAAKLIKIIVENGELKEADINIQSELSEIGISSFEFIKIIVMIEVEFGFEFEDDKLAANNFVTIRDLVEYIVEKE